MLGRDPAGPVPEAVQRERREFLAAITLTTEAEWDPAKHPRLGAPPNAGWFASTDGGGGGGSNTGAEHSHHLAQDATTGHQTKPGRTREAILNDLHAVNHALKKWKESAQHAWFIGPSQAEKRQLLERMRRLLDEMEPHLSAQERVDVAAWRDLQNGSKQIHDRLKNVLIRPIIRADVRSAEELEAARREARFQFLLVKNANQWWRMTNAERTELQSEIAARAAAYREKFHDEQGYSFFMRQLDKLVNPAWRGMGNMDDLLTLIGGVTPALRSPTPKLPLNTRPDIVSVSPAPAVPTQPLRPRVEPGHVGRNASIQGAVADANFAQTKINKARVFSPEGQTIFREITGRPINTVDDLASALRDKVISPSQLPVDYVIIEGKKMILNTRTSAALEEAGVPKSHWYGTNRTGQQVPGMPGMTFDDLALEQTKRNDLPPTGTSTPPRK